MEPSTRPPHTRAVSLALQGGGSHGAFTWGVLDALLADTRIDIEGLSGTSAGAVNAVALASGHASARGNRRDGAREALTRVWDEIGQWGAMGVLPARLGQALWGNGHGSHWAHLHLWAQTFGGLLSPYQTNPLGLNPLRDLLRRRIDFEALRQPGGMRVFVSATHVSTGKAAIFSGAALTVEAVAASACLPSLFQAVEIDGQAYWDGGYAVNPPLTPLIAHCTSADLIVVQINPLRREDRHDTAPEIVDRMNELTFNASLVTQMRAIDKINRLIADGSLAPGRCKPVRLHRIDGGVPMLAYTAWTKARSDPDMIHELFHLGQGAARDWLQTHFDALGERGTVDVARDYEDEAHVAGPQACGVSGQASDLAPGGNSVCRPK